MKRRFSVSGRDDFLFRGHSCCKGSEGISKESSGSHIELGDLRGGRIGKRKVRAEAFNLASGLLAYFISTVRDTRCVVVAVRGTGDLNDVLLDLSAYEIAVTAEDLVLPEDVQPRLALHDSGILL